MVQEKVLSDVEAGAGQSEGRERLGKFDLHVHTTMSDGSLDLREVIEVARARGVERHERPVGSVGMLGWRAARRRLGRHLDRGRKGGGKLELVADGGKPGIERVAGIVDGFHALANVTCATSIPPPRKPPSQYIR